MATHFSILAWRILMDRRACGAIVYRVTESDMTEQLSSAQFYIATVTNCHKLSGLKQHRFIISQLLSSEIQWIQLYHLLQVLQDWRQDRVACLSEGSRDKPTSTFIQIVVRIVSCSCRTKVFLYLLASNCAQLLEGAYIPWSCLLSPPYSK